MKRTGEMLAYSDFMAREVRAAGGTKPYRLGVDSEGFPVVRGRYGQVEYYGPEVGGEQRLRVYTTSAKLVRPLKAIGGVYPQQMGEGEARLWFKAGEAEVLRRVCAVIRARVRRVGGSSAEQMARVRGARRQG